MHDGVGQRLRHQGLLVQKCLGCVQAAGGHGPAKHLLRGSERAQVTDQAHLAAVLQQGHDGIGMAQRMNATRAQGRHGGSARSHAHKRHLARIHARSCQQHTGHHLGGRARCRNTDAPPTQIGRPAIARQCPHRHTQRLLRRPTLHHEGAEIMALALLEKGVLIGPRADMGRAVVHRLQRQRATSEVPHVHIQPLGLKKTQPVCNGQGQVVKHRLPTHRNGDAPTRGTWRLRPRCARARRHCRQDRHGAKGSAADRRKNHGNRKKGRIAAMQQSCRNPRMGASGSTPWDFYVPRCGPQPARFTGSR